MCPIRLHLQNTNSKLKFNNQNHSRKSLKTQMWGPSEHRALGTCTAGWPVRQPSHLETLDQSRGPPASTTILALSAWPTPCSASPHSTPQALAILPFEAPMWSLHTDTQASLVGPLVMTLMGWDHSAYWSDMAGGWLFKSARRVAPLLQQGKMSQGPALQQLTDR